MRGAQGLLSGGKSLVPLTRLSSPSSPRSVPGARRERAGTLARPGALWWRGQVHPGRTGGAGAPRGPVLGPGCHWQRRKQGEGRRAGKGWGSCRSAPPGLAAAAAACLALPPARLPLPASPLAADILLRWGRGAEPPLPLPPPPREAGSARAPEPGPGRRRPSCPTPATLGSPWLPQPCAAASPPFTLICPSPAQPSRGRAAAPQVRRLSPQRPFTRRAHLISGGHTLSLFLLLSILKPCRNAV